MSALPMTKPLPPVFAVCGVGDRWFLRAPNQRPHDRTFDRRELRAGGSGAIGSTTPVVAPVTSTESVPKPIYTIRESILEN